jgi:hypothetical protein
MVGGRFMVSLPFFVILVTVVLVLIMTSRHHRHEAARTDQRPCAACGEGHPAHASFCRRCGARLP